MITTDQSKCIRCHKCISICPFTVLKEENGYPRIDEKKTCLDCYHCVAICPENALYIDTDSGRVDCEPILEKEMALSKDFSKELEHHIQRRRSIRRYKDTPVSKELLNDILAVVKMAPSAKNQHPCKWVAVSGREKTDHIMQMVLRWVSKTGTSPEIKSEYDAGNNCVTLNAPNLLIAYGSESAINSYTDCTIALTSAELLLQARDIGTCWAGYLTRIANADEEINAYLGIPAGNRIYGILTLGYPDGEAYIRIPYRADADVKWI